MSDLFHCHSTYGSAHQVTQSLMKIAWLLRKHIRQQSKLEGMKTAQAEVLLVLIQDPQSNLCLSEVAEILGITRSSASDTVSQLVNQGLIQKLIPPNDKRSMSLHLTQRGLKQSLHFQTGISEPMFSLSQLSHLEQKSLNVHLNMVLELLQTRDKAAD